MDPLKITIGTTTLSYTEKDILSSKDIHKEIMDTYKIEYLKDLNNTEDAISVLKGAEKWEKELERIQMFSNIIKIKRQK